MPFPYLRNKRRNSQVFPMKVISLKYKNDIEKFGANRANINSCRTSNKINVMTLHKEM